MNIRPTMPGAVAPAVSSDAFRGAMRQFSGGVSVITVGAGQERSGMTATSVSALALDPVTTPWVAGERTRGRQELLVGVIQSA